MAATPAGICLLRVGVAPGAEEFFRGRVPAPAFSGERVVSSGRHSLLCRTRDAVLDYLHHATPLPPIPVDTASGTPFQKEVWAALCQIPFGKTRTYSRIAAAIGRPQAARAVGHACGRNPVAIIIPCHRVIGAGGKPGGYTGGLHIKRRLLSLENPEQAPFPL
ncbi:MAG: methylated-DNA--[protein]-cysteine S-methyltransferase [Deltaproteobacteria bacterium]|nr:methylated-DNA--[protein]-cysteine S-methyltransferase [Deltaproteobacteria bacterium]